MKDKNTYALLLLDNIEDKVKRLIKGEDVLPPNHPWDVPEGATNEQKLLVWIKYCREMVNKQ